MNSIKFDVVLACGGLGTRLRAITNNIPKPLFLVNGKCTLERCIQELDWALQMQSEPTHDCYMEDEKRTTFGIGW